MFINNISHEMLIHKKGSDNSLRPAVILCLSKQCLKLASCGEPKISDYSAKSISTLLTGAFLSGLIRDTLDPNGTLIACQSYIDYNFRDYYLSVALHKITNKS